MKELLPVTGYIRGGCSPIGMKKLFPTYIHDSGRGLAVYLHQWGFGACNCVSTRRRWRPTSGHLVSLS